MVGGFMPETPPAFFRRKKAEILKRALRARSLQQLRSGAIQFTVRRRRGDPRASEAVRPKLSVAASAHGH